MKSSSALKKPLYSALVFFGTLGVLSAGYAGFVSLQSSDADSGKSLTSSMMQAVIGNLADLDSRVSTMSGAVSSLQSGAGNLWSAVTGGIGYSGGKVGIGTDTPGAELQVQNSLTTGTPIDNAGIIIKSTNRNAYIALDATPTSAGSVVFYNSGTEKGRIAYYNSNNSLAFQTNTTDRMTIDSSGNVGIGITPTVYKLDVNGPARVSGLVGPTSGNFHLDSATSTSGLYLNWASGWNVYARTTLLASSDSRLKHDIVPLEHSLDKLAEVRGVSFLWNNEKISKDRQVWVVAQEVEKQFPELIREDGEWFKAVNYPGLVAPLIEAVKELKTRNEALEKRIEVLEAR